MTTVDPEFKVGDKAVCASCGHSIIVVTDDRSPHPYWSHEHRTFRHPARPKVRYLAARMLDYPPDLLAYNSLFNATVRTSGSGVETKLHMPCPRCIAPEWHVYNVTLSHEAMIAGATCKKCGFGMRGIPSEKPKPSTGPEADKDAANQAASFEAARVAARRTAKQSGVIGGEEAAAREMDRQVAAGNFAIQGTFLTISGKTYEFVQTSGPEPPPYLPPMRRVEESGQKS